MFEVLNVTLPIFGVIAAGVLFGRLRLLGEGSSEALNRYVFMLAFPMALFHGTAKAPLSETLNVPFLVAYIVGMLFAFAVAVLVSRRVQGEDAATACVDGVSASYPNTAYMGFPLFTAAFGADRLGPAIITSVATAIVLIAIAATWLEYLRHRGGGENALGKIAKAIVRNPLIIGSVLGLVWTAGTGGRPLPVAVNSFCALIGQTAGPCALFSIGLFLASRPMGSHIARVGWVTAIKMLVQPAATFALIALFLPTLDPFWAASAVLLAAMPSGGTTFVIAQEYETGVERASAGILVTTAISVVTLSLLLAWYGPMR